MNRFGAILAMVVLVAVPSVCSADGWFWWSSDNEGPEEPKWGSEEYYWQHADDPVGMRRHWKFGKPWPVQPRPTGEGQIFWHKYHSAHYWPWPYVCHDRMAIRSVVATQATNGWIEASTLYDYHFDPVTHELNSAGQEQLFWILSNAPPEARQTYVMSDRRPEVGQERVASVQAAIVHLTGESEPMPVTMRTTTPLGRPAREVEQIHRQSLLGMPSPTIGYTTVSGGGGGVGAQ